MANFRSFLPLFLNLAVLKHVLGTLTSTGQTLLLNDIPYYVPATPFVTIPVLSSLKILPSAAGLVPVTVVQVSTLNDSLSDLESIIEGFGVDDVWNEEFLEGKLSDK